MSNTSINTSNARTIHARLRSAVKALREAERNAVILFAEIMQRRLYRELGYADIRLYASEALGFSRSKTYEFIRLAEALDDLPCLKRSVAAGEVPWTKACEVVKVATPATEKRWLAIAERSSRRELAAKVVQSRALRDAEKRDTNQNALPLDQSEATPPVAPPVQTLSLRLDPLQRARFEALVETLMKRHHRSREEVVLMALEAFLVVGESSNRLDAESGCLRHESENTSNDSHDQPMSRGEQKTGSRAATPILPVSETARCFAPSSRQDNGDGCSRHDSENTTKDSHDQPLSQGEKKNGSRSATPILPVSETARCFATSSRLDAHSPYQIIIQQCPTCGSQTVGAERLSLTAAQAAQIACDARILEPGKRNRSTIPPSRRRAVLERDNHRCRVPGCGATSFLEIHHIRPRAAGGDNSKDNLVTLCSRCHRHLHEERSAIGDSPWENEACEARFILS